MVIFLKITMINYYNASKRLQSGFIEFKGKASIKCLPPVNIAKIICDTIYRLIHKRPDEKILIIIGDYSYKTLILDELKNAYNLGEFVFLSEHIQFLGKTYAYTNLYKYIVNILIGIDDIKYIEKSYIESKFTLCVITNPKLKLQFYTGVWSKLPNIDLGITDNDIVATKINTPIKEYRHPLNLSEEENIQYKKYTDFIKDSMTVFNNFETVEYCRIGCAANYMSAIDYCTKIAFENGWNTELDMSVEFNVQIDKIYNPNAIHERAQILYNITRERKDFFCSNKNKINEVINIIKANLNRRIVVVCKSGDFANEIQESLIAHDIPCGAYHNEIPASYMPDENGNNIVYKSGENKGKPKLFKSSSLSTYWQNVYNLKGVNVLCIKATSSVDLNIDIDTIIFTTTLIDDIFKFKARFRNCIFPNDVTEIHRIYFANTIEESSMNKENPSNLITICNKSITAENLTINSETGDIII